MKDIWLLVNNAHIHEHELQFVGGFIAITTFDIMVILKKDVCLSNKASSRRGGMKTQLVRHYVLPMVVMGFENVELSQEVMFSFWLKPKLRIPN
jgi:hypothetical protein